MSAQTLGRRGIYVWSATDILEVLDDCCEAFTFPMLDNGYVYLAATRLSLHRSLADWALVIEVFGFSPRSGLPDLHIHTFGSRLRNRDKPSDYVSQEAYDNYIGKNPHNQSRFFRPIEPGPWQDGEDLELVAAPAASAVHLRGQALELPRLDQFESNAIILEEPARIRTFELCRLLASTHRNLVLATPEERRVSVPDELDELLVLDEWRHPDVVNDELPSDSETFIRLAGVLADGDRASFRACETPNTHWSNWPDGGSL